MRRGRIFIYLALIIIVILAGAAIWWWKSGFKLGIGSAEPTTTPQVLYVEIITAGQNIYPGTAITADMLSTIRIPQDQLVSGEFTNPADVVGLYSKLSITQGVPIVSSMLSVTPGTVSLPGSRWAPFIPQGLTAVPIPITRLTSVAYGIRDGDYVNIISTFLVVDVDTAYQTILPNLSGLAVVQNETGLEPLLNLTAQVVPSETSSPMGRVEIDEELDQLFYVVPSESQRPRLVTQMIMQNVQVLHVGTFPLPGEVVDDQLIAPTPGPGPTATPAPGGTGATATAIVRPDIITLMVPNQDAVTLTWLVYSGAQITLTLRNPNDQVIGPQPEAATLEYLLTQYDIPLPPVLPIALQPRTDTLMDPLSLTPLFLHFYQEMYPATPR